jgi:hypothetical protein
MITKPELNSILKELNDIFAQFESRLQTLEKGKEADKVVKSTTSASKAPTK